MAHILVVEDDPDIASVLMRGLGAAGHQVEWAETAETVTTHISRNTFDAAIIDMMLGESSGAGLLAKLRARGHQMPVIMLSALSRVEDRAEGLEAGAQDYVVKPFQLSELLARLEVQLRRTAPKTAPITLGRLTYDPRTRTVTGAGRNVTVTDREGDLLGYVLSRPGAVLTRGEIFDAIWAGKGGATDNVVDVYLGYLRRKLDGLRPYGLALRTLRGRGFVLTTEDFE